MSAIVVEGQLVHYEVLGRGRPVILLHGMIGSWRYWVPLLQRLQQSYRLYALDLFGFGDSAHSPDHFPLDKQVELVQAFMDEMGLPKTAFIGHGLGALVAAEFARQHPDHAARLLLVSLPLFDTGDLDHRVPPAPVPIAAPAPPPPVAAPAKPAETPLPTVSAGASAAMRAALAEAARARRPAQEEPRPAPVVTAEMPKPAAPAAPVLSAPSSPPADGPRRNELAPILAQPLESLLARCYRRSDETFPKMMVDVAKAHPQAPALLASGFDAGSLLDLLRTLPMPTVAVHGNDDAVFPAPPEEVWAYITADADRVFLPILLPGVRHFPMLEDERFYRIASDFLELADITRIEIRERWRRRAR